NDRLPSALSTERFKFQKERASKVAPKNRNGKWNEHRVDGMARAAVSTFRIAHGGLRDGPDAFQRGSSTFLQGNALESIDSQRDIRADVIVAQSWEPPPTPWLI
ncbi:MAG: hypothetical protein WBW67_23635, partial [Pseudolabrys sp.]